MLGEHFPEALHELGGANMHTLSLETVKQPFTDHGGWRTRGSRLGGRKGRFEIVAPGSQICEVVEPTLWLLRLTSTSGFSDPVVVD